MPQRTIDFDALFDQVFAAEQAGRHREWRDDYGEFKRESAADALARRAKEYMEANDCLEVIFDRACHYCGRADEFTVWVSLQEKGFTTMHPGCKEKYLSEKEKANGR